MFCLTLSTRTTRLVGISIPRRFSAGEAEAYCIGQTLFGGFRAPPEQACPLLRITAPGEGTNSLSKVSMKRLSRWSVTSATERKLPLSSVSLSQLAFPWTPRTPWGRTWEERAKEKALLISSEPWELSNVKLLSLRDPSAPEEGKKSRNPFPTRACVFVQGLPVALPFTHSLISRRFIGATDTGTVSVCSAKVLGAGQAAQWWV